MSLLLTTQERERFAAWLEHEAETDAVLIQQMEKLGPAFASVAATRKQEVVAAMMIARKLRATEGMSIE